MKWWWCVVARVTLSAATTTTQQGKIPVAQIYNNNKNRANQANKSAVEFLDASANIENCSLCVQN